MPPEAIHYGDGAMSIKSLIDSKLIQRRFRSYTRHPTPVQEVYAQYPQDEQVSGCFRVGVAQLSSAHPGQHQHQRVGVAAGDQKGSTHEQYGYKRLTDREEPSTSES